ncbi:response regulator [Metallumcola ferriviriculae]|uniref:Stage 0 sporulation protein A homolog n=1 Tax=Metallumcola ferriviriculae TaxID=3039180 RepID=A0AAU0UW40_9FIRM|nr:response regulator [Desulfitibacteraceae bacterium MK1]
MKLKALIVDDEYPARKELRFLLDQFENVEVVGEATNAREALKLISALNYSVLFLDVEMPGMTGLELSSIIQELPKRPYIIFVTAYEEYAVKAFEVNAVDYLLKPFDEKRLHQAMQKLFKLVEKNKEKEKAVHGSGEEHTKLDRLPVEKDGKTLLIPETEIIYAYTQDDSVFLKTTKDLYVSKYTLKELESRLNSTVFFRTHRCYIVNLGKVQEIIPFFNGTYNLVVNDDHRSKVPVSRNQAKNLKKFLGM